MGRDSEVAAARQDPRLAVVEGFHACKHAIRFGADIVAAVTGDRDRLLALARDLAPDTLPVLEWVAEITPDEFAACAPGATHTGVVAVARRVEHDPAVILAGPGLVVYLDQPRHPGNVGAVIRVAAAAGAAGVLVSGTVDPWHPTVIRGAAGLQFAVPVATVADLPATDRPVWGLDPDGAPLAPGTIPARAVLGFGTERHGLGEEFLSRCERRVRIPMMPGVSSLNLATAVAVALYSSPPTGNLPGGH